MTGTAPTQTTTQQVAFSDDLRDLPDRAAVEALLVANETMNENTVRRKNYVSAAGQECSMLEVASQDSSLVACRDTQGVWNVRRAYGDMDLSANLPPATLADDQPMFAAVIGDPVLQQVEKLDSIVSTHTIHHAVIGEIPPLSETNMAIAQGVSDAEIAAYETSMHEMAAHMQIEPAAPIARVETASPQTGAPAASRWQERRSSAVTLVADRPRSTLGAQARRSSALSDRRL